MRTESIATLTIAALSLIAGNARAADPTTADCLAASDASLKSGNEHKLRSERSQLLVCAAATCPVDIRKECAHRVEEVNAQIPTITFQVKDVSGADRSAVKVTMDGEALTERLEGTALSIDPGEHAFTFEVSGRTPVTRKFVIQQAQKDRRELVTLGEPTLAPQQPMAAPLVESPQFPTTSAEPSASPRPGPQKILALVTGGIGVVGLGVGTAFGVVTLSKKSDAQNACPGTSCPTSEGSNDWSHAKSTGNISTVGFIAGGFLIAGAAALWVTAPTSRNAQVGLGLGAIQVKGSW